MQTQHNQSNTPVPDLILDIEVRLKEEIQALQLQKRQAQDASARWAGTPVRSAVTADNYAVRNTVRSVAEWTVLAAERLLSKPGAPAKCDAAGWLDARFQNLDEDSCADFSPTELWRHLSDTYAPERIEHEARARAAKTLHNCLQLWRSDEVKRVGGRVRLDLSISSELRYGSKERHYNHYAETRFNGCKEAMEVFASAQGINLAGYDLMGLATHLQQVLRYDFSFSSGDRKDFHGGMSVCCFNTGLKIYLPIEVANQLNAFLTLYREEH